MTKDPLGDRMKVYENIENDRKFIPLLPIMIRIDGKCFSSFTQGLMRPYDPRLSRLMKATTKHLVEKTNSLIGYTQSDEISLVMYSDNYDSKVYFDGRIKKLDSTLAAMATGYFNRHLGKFLPEKLTDDSDIPTFDCKSWQVPNKEEAANTFLWRSLDATRNSISMVAQGLYPQTELQNHSTDTLLRMCKSVGTDWGSFPEFFRYGTFFQRRTVQIEKRLTQEEISLLPPLHNARKAGVISYTREQVQELNMSRFNQVTNRSRVIFNREDPIYEE